MTGIQTPDEARFQALLDALVGNKLSSVKIGYNSKGYTWQVKAYHENPFTALKHVVEIEKQIEAKYGKKGGKA